MGAGRKLDRDHTGAAKQPDATTGEHQHRAGPYKFLDERGEAVSTGAQLKARYLLNALKRFSENKGYVLIEQWLTMDVREF